MNDYDNIPSSHWKQAEPISTGINRHRITSRQVVRAISKKQDRTISQRWRYNIAARIATIYDLFLGRADQKPFLVERSSSRVKYSAD